MKLVIQRVRSASVGKSKISEGLFVLVGFGEGDNEEMVYKMAKKLTNLRILDDGEGKMNLSSLQKKTEILIVSQFTLYGNTFKGNRPSFVGAMEPGRARKLYDMFVEEVRRLGVSVETGTFGKEMLIKAELSGPVTILMDNG